MSINDPHKYVSNLWDWQCLDGCFGMTIKPSDIDGHVERGGFYLYIETKAPTVTQLSNGQQKAIVRRVRDGITTYMVVWGKPGQPEAIHVYRPAPNNRNAPEKHDDADINKLRQLCSDWYAYADNPRNLWHERLAEAAQMAQPRLVRSLNGCVAAPIKPTRRSWLDPAYGYKDLFSKDIT